MTAYQGATLRDVLNMSSGVRYIEDYEALDSHIAATDIASGWKPPRPDFHGTRVFVGPDSDVD